MSKEGKTGKYPFKILHPGLQRAGSTSLSEALKILGITKGVWHPLNQSNALNQKGLSYWIDNKFDEKIENNEMNGEIFDKWLNHIECDCLMDAPSGLYWQQIYQYYPKCKVIVTMRDYDEVFDSSLFWMKTIAFSFWFEYIVCPLSKEANWVRNVYIKKVIEKVLQFSDANSFDELMNNREYFKQFCEKKIETIKEVIPKEQLLIYSVSDGWEPLCKFLKVRIPDESVKFPLKNNKGTIVSTILRSYLKLENFWYCLLGGVVLFVCVLMARYI